jgi:hypothetical protein
MPSDLIRGRNPVRVKKALPEEDRLTISSDLWNDRVPIYPLHPPAADVALPQGAGELQLHADNKAHSQG